LFYNNSGGSAPAFYASMSGLTESYTANFYNVTASGNTSSASGGGAFEAQELSSDYPAKLNFYNSLLAGNMPQDYNDKDNPGNMTLTSTVTAVSGADVFVNPSKPAGDDGKIMTADDGFQLSIYSPAVSFGDESLLYSGIDKDITGNTRIINKLDAGAYESEYIAPLAGDGTGGSWENATSDLHNAIHTPNVEKVFVASW
jgi:hypothetical protein